MTAEDVRHSVIAWCASTDDLEVAGDRAEAGADFALGVRVKGAAAPMEVEVLQAAGADRLTVRHVATVAGDAQGAARRLIDSRPGGLTASVDAAGSTVAVTAQTYVYLDGLSKHTFVHAVHEVARTGRLLGALAGAQASTASVAAAQSATPAGQTASATPGAASPAMASPSFAPAAGATQQATPAQTAPAQAQWVPTHSVPPQGMRSWAAPDPNGPVVANLAPGLPIQVTEVRGAWARIVCSNGWTGWIDGRIIGVAA